MVICPCVSLTSVTFINPRINFYTNLSTFHKIFKELVLKTGKKETELTPN